MNEAWLFPLKVRFEFNLRRVRGIVASYEQLGGTAPGRSSVGRADLLRAAVVFLHATLEDLLRSIATVRLPLASPRALRSVAFPDPENPRKRLEKITLETLAAYRADSVMKVIQLAVEDHVRLSSYNNTDELASLLLQIGLAEARKEALMSRYGSRLAALMARRHLIVHRADSNTESGRGQHPAASLARRTVDDWTTKVEYFGRDLIEELSRTGDLHDGI